jgi:hypothetical protein
MVRIHLPPAGSLRTVSLYQRRVLAGVNALSGPLDGVLGADILRSFDIDLDLPGAPYDPLPRAKLRSCLAGLGPTLRSDRGGSISEQPLVLFGAARRPQDQRICVRRLGA